MKSCANPNSNQKQFIVDATKLSEKMLKMAEKGIQDCKEDSCLQLYGVIRDCGYKIRKTAEQEQAHTL